jgi:anti-sigma regulatory factor (Ser/Thr protein kinase)
MVDTRLDLRPDTGELARLVDAIEAFAASNGLDPAVAGRLTLALDEIVTNAISYGGLPADASIAVELGLDGPDVVATVSDPGPAFDPLAEAPTVDIDAPLDERMPGGLGLFIVRTIARDLAYAREGALNRLTMRLAR